MRVTFFLFVCSCLSAMASELRLGAGATDHQVFQRDTGGTAALKLGGTAEDLDGQRIEGRLLTKGKVVKGWNWKNYGSVAGSTWTLDVPGVPAGGPYELELRAGKAAVIALRDILVGDLWVLAGQSNMEGVGNLTDVQQPDERIHNFDQLDQWVVAKEPLHELPGATDRVHWRKNAAGEPERLTGDALNKFREARRKGAGLGLPFAAEMLRRTNIPVGLISCAHGGTSMTQWDPAARDKAGDSLYGSMYRRVQAVGGKVKGVLWYQGESDASAAAAPLFAQKFEDLITAVRRDFNDPKLPFLYVQLGRHINDSNQPYWNQVQEAQRLAEGKIPGTGVVTAIDGTLDDAIHVSTPSLKRLGVRLANIASEPGKRSPRAVSARYQPTTGNFGTVTVRFDETTGKLKSPDRVAGFSIHDASGKMLPLIYKSEIGSDDGKTVILSVQGTWPSGAVLHYGFGKNPVCNLTDDADMAALVFGPMPIESAGP